MAKEAGVTARKQPLSGQLADFPGDVVVAEFLGECKAGYTTNKTFHLNYEWLHKISKQAKEQGYKAGMLLFRPDGTTEVFAALPYSILLELLHDRNTTTET